MSTCGTFLAWKVSAVSKALMVSALPMELMEITRLQTLPKAGFGGPLCFSPSCLQSQCLSLHLLFLSGPVWTFFRYWWAVLWSRPPSCVDLQLSVASTYILNGPCPPDWFGAALCCPTFLLLLCGPAFWLVRAAVSCAWSNHVAPPTVASHGSVKRQGPPSTHPPASPSQSHALEQKLRDKYFTAVCLHSCVGLQMQR